MVTSQGPCGENVHHFEMFAILQYVAQLAATLLLGNRHFHSKHFVSHSFWVVLMLAPEYEVDVTTRNGVIAHFT